MPESPQNEAIIEQLKKVRESLSQEEWRDARIYRHIDEYKLDFTLIATKVSSGQVHYYVPDTGVFEPLNLLTVIQVSHPALEPAICARCGIKQLAPQRVRIDGSTRDRNHVSHRRRVETATRYRRRSRENSIRP